MSTWGTQFPEDTLVLELPRASAARAEEVKKVAPFAQIRIRPFRIHAANVVLRFGFGARYDTIVTQNFVAPFSRQHKTVFLHDAIFQEHAEWFSRRERLYLSLIPRLLVRANLILTSSVSEGNRIQRLNPNVRVPIKPVGLGVPSDFLSAVSAKPPLKVLPNRYLLTVGRLNIRKNIEMLAKALISRGLISSDFPLVIVGTPDGEAGEQTKTRAGVQDGSILFCGGISNSELKWLYEHTAVFIFPSLDEGFGLPVIEASASGARQALSDIPAFREFGDVGEFFDPTDPDDIASKVSVAFGASMPPSGAANIDTHSWSEVVTRMRREVLRSVASGMNTRKMR